MSASSRFNVSLPTVIVYTLHLILDPFLLHLLQHTLTLGDIDAHRWRRRAHRDETEVGHGKERHRDRADRSGNVLVGSRVYAVQQEEWYVRACIAISTSIRKSAMSLSAAGTGPVVCACACVQLQSATRCGLFSLPKTS